MQTTQRERFLAVSLVNLSNREVYRLDCVSPTETSDFEFVLPAIDLQCNCEINDEYDLDACDLVSNRTPKMQLNYSFLGTNLLNQQNNDNLPYAA